MSKVEIPLLHFQHLKRLATLRRCSLEDALDFMMTEVAPCDEDRLTQHFGSTDAVRSVDLGGYRRDEVLARIQGLPRNIRPVTDGPYLKNFRFVEKDDEVIGIEAEGVTVFDFKRRTRRDADVFALVRDLLPQMSVEEYRLYNTFNSQYLRLVREPELFTMPKGPGMAIDAGCYVGYKAFAMARFTEGGPVLAFELLPDIFRLLERNVAANPSLNIRPVRCALSNTIATVPVFTRDEKTMANSLTDFASLKEANTALLSGSGKDETGGQGYEYITTELLDDHTREGGPISCLHISVNGHEPEVIGGGKRTAKEARILRVSAPYRRDGQPVRDLVVEELRKNGIKVFGISGAAVIAGKELNGYHAVPLEHAPVRRLGRIGRFRLGQGLRRAWNVFGSGQGRKSSA